MIDSTWIRLGRPWTRPAAPVRVGERGVMISVNGEEYLTVKEATRLLGVKPATLYAYVSRGVLRSYRQGIKRQRLYRRVEAQGLLRLAPSATRRAHGLPFRPAPRPCPIPLAPSAIRD